MRRALLVCLSLLSACKRSAPAPAQAPEPADAAVTAKELPLVTAVSAPSGSGAPAPPPSPPLPVASDTFEVVARGNPSSKLVWLQVHGTRTWLSTRGFDAFAEGDGPLIKGRDPLEKLPYKAGQHHLRVVGRWPKLVALRVKIVETRAENVEPTAFLYSAEENGPGTWREAKPIPYSSYPHAFVPYRDGAVFVTGSLMLNASASYSDGDVGTALSFIAPDGSVTDPKLGVHGHYQAWHAAGDGESLSLIGTIAVTKKAPAADDLSKYDESGVHVLRIGRDGAQKTVAVQRATLKNAGLPAYYARVNAHAGSVVVVPPEATEFDEWKPNVRAVWIVDPAGRATFRTVGGDGVVCKVTDAVLAGDDLYAVRANCNKDSIDQDLVRVDAQGQSERVKLPAGCSVTGLALREPDDLWLSADCGQILTIFRRGRPQTPVTLP